MLFWISYRGSRGMTEDLVEAANAEQADAIAQRYCENRSFRFVPASARPAIIADASILETPPAVAPSEPVIEKPTIAEQRERQGRRTA